MTVKECSDIHALIVEDKWIEAATLILEKIGQKREIANKSKAISIAQGLFQYLLDNDSYLNAATLQWGSDVFNAEPESVRRSFAAINRGSMVLLQGASSMGKTYGLGAWMLLDYLRDPYYTAVKLAAVSEDHLKKNLFAHVATLFRSLSIPPPHPIIVQDSALWIGIKQAGYEFGISGLAFKQSQETSGQFKGYKVKPVRMKRHPRFGVMSRLRVLGDEGQNWPGGPFKDLNTAIASITGDEAELIKIAIAYNPETTSSHVVQLAEPPDGWSNDDMETLYDWESKAGWQVCRLDAARCENVMQRKMVYPGLQTYEGYMKYLRAGGDNSANFCCFARGWPPLSGSVNTVIPPTWPQQARGEATFVETPVMFAAADLAFMGKDTAQMAVGRWGLASGWKDNNGKWKPFVDRLNLSNNKPRHVLQIDQILPLQKSDNTVIMAEEIMGRCKMLGIVPENVAVDSTGYGFGVHGHLTKVFGPCMGIIWNEKATEKKILAEDLEGADKQVSGVMSEMWWAFRRWLDPVCNAILINPIIPPQPIHTQLTARRYEGKSGIKVESKEKYRARNQSSPDEADALVMLVHVVRRNSSILPGLVEQEEPTERQRDYQKITFTTVGKMVTSDESDSISDDGKVKEDRLAGVP